LPENVGRSGGDELRIPRLPIQALQLIREDHARDFEPLGNHHFERIALDLIRDRSKDSEFGSAVVDRSLEDERWPAAGLLVTGAGIEIDRDKFAAIRNPTGATRLRCQPVFLY
jgi:hypothetical protein